MAIYKVTKVSEDGTMTCDSAFCNDYGARYNAVTLNMILHNISAHEFINKKMREKYDNDNVWIPSKRINTKDRAYVNHGADVYCVMKSD